MKHKKLNMVAYLFLAYSMVSLCMPLTAFAASSDNLCEHHPEHTVDCGYAVAVAGSDCTHTHDEICGYVEAVAEVHCSCTATDDVGSVIHIEGCGYIAPVTGAACTHIHDGTCGYVESKEEQSCIYECTDCANSSGDGGTSPPVTCTCVTKCVDSGNSECAVCGTDNADLSACTGKEQEDNESGKPSALTENQNISVNISWGAMEFTFTDGKWQTDTHTYSSGTWVPDANGGDLITITNNGASTVNVILAYSEIVTEVKGSFNKSSPIVLATNESQEIKLILSGKPSGALENAALGSVTITITLPEE